MAQAEQTVFVVGRLHAVLTHWLTLHATQPHSLPEHGRHPRSFVRLGAVTSISFGSVLQTVQFRHARLVVGVGCATMNCPVVAHVAIAAHCRLVVGVRGADSYCVASSHAEADWHVRKVVDVGADISNSDTASHVTLQSKSGGRE